MTDTSIISRALQAAGVSRHSIQAGLPDFFNAASEAYERYVPPDLRPYHTPYARPALERLREAGAYLGLVTGNIQRIAWVKLRAAELAEYFAGGGFGDEAAEREQLPPLAITRLEEHYHRTFLPEQVVVVGDTPQDVACGKVWGLVTVAVATGPPILAKSCAPPAPITSLTTWPGWRRWIWCNRSGFRRGKCLANHVGPLQSYDMVERRSVPVGTGTSMNRM